LLEAFSLTAPLFRSAPKPGLKMAASLEQPKKPVGGAFGQFIGEKRSEIAAGPECKGKPPTAVLKEASVQFKALDEAQRKVWDEKYEQAKKKFDKDMEAFLAAGGEKKALKRKGGNKDDKKAAKKLKKKNKDPDAPKRPTGGAFGCFLAKNRAAFTKECAGKPITEVSKLASVRWKAVDDKEKEVFNTEYEAKKAAYDDAMKTYVPPAGSAAAEPAEPTKKEAKTAAKQAKSDAKEAKAAQKDAKKTAKSATKPAAAKQPVARGKTAKAKKQEPAQPELQATVAAKAEKAGLTEKLLQLAARQDVIDSGATQSKMLAALEESGGLIHPAKRALLGA